MKPRFPRALKMTILASAFATTACTASASTTANYSFATLSGQEYATLSVVDLGTSSWSFTLHLLDNFNTLFGGKAYADILAVDANKGPEKVSVSGIIGDISKIRSNDADKPYDFNFNFGTGRNELVTGNTVSWTASYYGEDCSRGPGKKSCLLSLTTSGSTPFALHIQDIGNRGKGDQWFSGAAVAAAPVPEPETYGMMLAGLGMIGAIVRRRQQRH